MKKWYKSKTYIVNILIAIIGILEVNQHLLLTTLVSNSTKSEIKISAQRFR